MRISKSMVKYYIGLISETYYIDHNEAPEGTAEYEPYVDAARVEATASGDLPYLLSALEKLLAEADADLRDEYGGSVFPLTSDEVRDIVYALWHGLTSDEQRAKGYPDEPVGMDLPRIEWMERDEWAALREGAWS